VEPVQDIGKCYDQMAIMEKFETVIEYLYPIIQSMPRRHSIARDQVLGGIFQTVEIIYEAGKSNQISKIYAVDARLALLRFHMRFLVRRKCMSPHQLSTAQALVAEVGRMVGAWVKKKKKQGQTGS
jgi:hypothetical protein